MAQNTNQEILDGAVKELPHRYNSLELLDPSNQTNIQGVVYVSCSATLFSGNQPFAQERIQALCQQAGYIAYKVSPLYIKFWVPLTKVLENCAAIAKAPKFEKIVDSTGDLDWKARQNFRLSVEERAYVITHQEEYNRGPSNGRGHSWITPRAVAEGIRAKNPGKAARSALIASFNKDMYPWVALALNINASITDRIYYRRIEGFKISHRLQDLRMVAVTSRRDMREAIRAFQDTELLYRKVSVFFRRYKGKNNIELKDIIITKCLEKIFLNPPKYMDISPFSVVAKALSK